MKLPFLFAGGDIYDPATLMKCPLFKPAVTLFVFCSAFGDDSVFPDASDAFCHLPYPLFLLRDHLPSSPVLLFERL